MVHYKPNIFISSTIRGMPNERAAALKAIEQVGAIPVMSEFTINAQSIDSVSTCLNNIRESHIYILILGGVYGWKPYGDKSITELEYLTAQENNIPTLVFNTNYPKEPLQEEFSKRVGATYFWKVVNDAFELKDAIANSIKEEMDKWEKEVKTKTEPIYANLLKISFPEKLYIADLDLDRDEVIANSRTTEKWLKDSASWFDVAVSAIHQKGIKFPHDWTIHRKQVVTFHDLTDHNMPLGKICDLGTVTPLYSSEFYNNSPDDMNVFKSLLSRCLQTKLFKKGIHWYKNEKLFVFMPVTKFPSGKWKTRTVEWTRKKKATRTVAKVVYGKKDPNKIKYTKHLAFSAHFHFLDDEWLLSIRPDWLITFGDFKVSQFGFKHIQSQKRDEKNLHVFNHLNFILWYLQPDGSMELFQENEPYKFLSIDEFIKLNSWPIICDEVWRNNESKAIQSKLEDKNGFIDLFAK